LKSLLGDDGLPRRMPETLDGMSQFSRVHPVLLIHPPTADNEDRK